MRELRKIVGNLQTFQTWHGRLFIAFIISLFGHVILFFTLERWKIVPSPEIINKPVIIEAHLVPMKPSKAIRQLRPVEQTPKNIKPKVYPKINKEEKPIASSTEEKTLKDDVASAMKQQEAMPAPQPPASEQLPIGPSMKVENTAASDEPLVDMDALPHRLLIRFTVRWGENGIGVGNAEYVWMKDGNTYILQSTTQSTGIVDMFKSMKLVQTSSGEITNQGLRPQVFSLERTGKPRERALFRWDENSVTFENNDKNSNVSLPPGTQDIMSVLFQFAFVPPTGNDLHPFVVMGSKLEKYHLEIVGEEELSFPQFGNLRTLHLKRVTENENSKFDVWLAQERYYLPVKILRTEKKDSRPIELVASEILVPEKN